MPLCLIAPLAYISYAFMVFVLMTPPRYNAPTPTGDTTMANATKQCDFRNLYVLAYIAGFTHWCYKPTDAANCLRSNYFNKACDMLTVGDIIVAVGRAPLGAVQLLVTKSGLDSVVVVPMCATPGVVS